MSSNIGMEMTHELVDISLLNLPDLEPYLSELNHPKSKNPDSGQHGMLTEHPQDSRKIHTVSHWMIHTTDISFP